MDGSRLLNAAVGLSLPVKELAKDVDSVSFCFSKVVSFVYNFCRESKNDARVCLTIFLKFHVIHVDVVSLPLEKFCIFLVN